MGLALTAGATSAGKAKTTEVQILGLNDFHGALEEPGGSGGRIGTTNAGGVGYLAPHVDQLRATNPNTLFVSRRRVRRRRLPLPRRQRRLQGLRRDDLPALLPPIVDAMEDAIDVVVTGHTNWAVNCEIDGKIVTRAASNGRLITDIDLSISRATKDVVSATVDNKIVTRVVPKAPALTTLVEKYRTQVVLSCTGTQIDALLEQQFRAAGSTILQVSDGFAYTWSAGAPLGSRVDIGAITLDGTPLVADQSYRITTNNFLATGGDGFTVFTGCTDALGGEIDLDALVT